MKWEQTNRNKYELTFNPEIVIIDIYNLKLKYINYQIIEVYLGKIRFISEESTTIFLSRSLIESYKCNFSMSMKLFLIVNLSLIHI